MIQACSSPVGAVIIPVSGSGCLIDITRLKVADFLLPRWTGTVQKQLVQRLPHL
jgi:hypothetical protein